MQVVLVVSRMFSNTREFSQHITREAGLRITLLEGDARPETALRAMRVAARTWFEGVGPLLLELIRSPASWRLPQAYLRVGLDEVDSLPLPELWSVVSDLVLPSHAAAAAVRERMSAGLTPPGRLHVVGDIFRQIRGEVVPGEDLQRLYDLLLKQPGQLPGKTWETISAVGEACRGRVLIYGNAPQELRDHLAGALGLEVLTDADPDTSTHVCASQLCEAGRRPASQSSNRTAALDGTLYCGPASSPVDSVVFWESLAACNPTTAFDAALVRLRPGGAVVAVTPESPVPLGWHPAAVAAILDSRSPGRAPVRVCDNVLVISGDPALQGGCKPLASQDGGKPPALPGDAAASPASSPPRSDVQRPAILPRLRRTPPPTHSASRCKAVETCAVAPSADVDAVTPVAVAAASGPAGPLVTAIIPVYNDDKRVGRAIDSLRRQTYKNLEILVIDDGSTDDTAQVVAKHFDDPRVRYLYKPHSGRPETRNLGVREARGDFVAWLGSDDESTPNRIAAQMAAIDADPSVDIVHSDGFIFFHDGELHSRRSYEAFTPEAFPRQLFLGLARVCPILDTSALIRRNLYDRIGLYDLAFSRCQDYEFYLRAAMAGDVRCAHVPLTLVKVYRGPPSADRNGPIMDFYVLLAGRMLEFFGAERLMDPMARDLHLDPRLFAAEVFTWMSIAFRAAPDHAINREADARLKEVVNDGTPANCADAHKLLGLLALARGDGNLATLYFGRARDGAAPAGVKAGPALCAVSK
jgi:glycosyltransferase involved in cell wall biosynthesis